VSAGHIREDKAARIDLTRVGSRSRRLAMAGEMTTRVTARETKKTTKTTSTRPMIVTETMTKTTNTTKTTRTELHVLGRGCD
jgi:hypothetical protein